MNIASGGRSVTSLTGIRSVVPISIRHYGRKNKSRKNKSRKNKSRNNKSRNNKSRKNK